MTEKNDAKQFTRKLMKFMPKLIQNASNNVYIVGIICLCAVRCTHLCDPYVCESRNAEKPCFNSEYSINYFP